MKIGIIFRNLKLLTLAGILASGPTLLWAKSQKKGEFLPAEELKWEANPGRPDEISVADVWGSSKKGAHAAIHKWKAGTKGENHTHSANYRGVIISGTMEVGPEGALKKLGPGSYFNIPSDVPHVSNCIFTTDCIFYMESSGKLDFKMAKKPKI